MRFLKFISAAAFSASLLFATERAHATAEFPGLVVSHLKVTCADGGSPTPDCIMCHQNDNGGLGTATRPFGAWMKQNGLTAFADSKLDTLLDQAASEKVDSNCDGLVDTDQIEACDWEALETTGDAGCASTAAVTILYGCSAAPTTPAQSSDRSDPVPASAAIGISALLVAALASRKLKLRQRR